MPKEKIKAYIVNVIGILFVFGLLCVLLDTTILGSKTNYLQGIIIMCMITRYHGMFP